MAKKAKTRTSLFEDLKSALEDSIAYSKGELSLKTTTLPGRPPHLPPKEVVATRKRLKMSQPVFAAVLNVSVKTVQSWEQGVREPSDAALRLLQLVRADSDIASRIFDGPNGTVISSHNRRGTRLTNAKSQKRKRVG